MGRSLSMGRAQATILVPKQLCSCFNALASCDVWNKGTQACELIHPSSSPMVTPRPSLPDSSPINSVTTGGETKLCNPSLEHFLWLADRTVLTQQAKRKSI